ncbi:MAG: sigma-70 family RNA polymerase sigma factor [Dehalococcoidia bacterium]
MSGLDRTDEELVLLVRGRDERAFETLYDRYADLVYSVALRVLADPTLAQDVAQEVFLRIWRAPESFDIGRGRFSNWLVSVARNRAVDEVRLRGRRRLREVGAQSMADDPPDGQAEDPAVAAQTEIERSAVRRALFTLPVEQRTALELAYFGGMTQQEIAELLNQPLGTVKTRTRLAMKKLRHALAADVEVGRSG